MIFTFLFVFFLSISSVKNNQVDSPESDSKEVHPDESTKLFHELKASRQREKDLNETIENILEEMTQMKNNIHQLEETILHLEDTIGDVASEATLNANHNAEEIVIVAEAISLVNISLKEDVSSVNFTLSFEIRSLYETMSSEINNVNSSTNQLIEDNRGEIEDNKREIEENKRDIEENQGIITELSLHGQWCAYQYGWGSDNAVISYDSSFFEDSNINNNALNVGTGVFTAPRAGVYLITFSYYVVNDPGEQTDVFLHLNGARLEETRHLTYYSSDGSGRVDSTGGRAVYQRLEAGDTLTLQTATVSGDMYYIMFCVEFKQ